MKGDIPVPAAIVLGASAVVGGVSIGIAMIDHYRSTQRGERMPKVGLRGPVDYLLLTAAIAVTILGLPAAWEQWSNIFEEVPL